MMIQTIIIIILTIIQVFLISEGKLEFQVGLWYNGDKHFAYCVSLCTEKTSGWRDNCQPVDTSRADSKI